MTCPTCRGNWTDRSRPDIERFRIEQELDGQAVQVYLDWLYSSTLHIDASVSRTEDDFNVVLLQCWEVSEAMDDEGFRDAVIQEFFNEAEAHFWARSIDYAFVDGKGSDAMRDFVMDIFLTRVSYDWFKTEGRKWPKTFVQKLADHCMKKALSGERIKSYEEIEAVYVKLEEDEDKDAWMKRVSADEDDVEDLPLPRPQIEMTKRRPSFPTAEETQPPARKQRKLTKNQAAITAAVYSAILPCLDLIDPLMEFTRACSSTKTSSTKRKTADAQEQKGKKKAGKRTKKTNKSQTEVERLGGPVQDEPKLRRSSRLKAPDLESLNRVEDSAGEEDLEGQDAANEDVAGARLGTL
ncbi:hypothetical protein N0V87_001706 [Didymella glomerata]|uniref:Uncharacterized protein n=1 Tax=Didymella glomerata TaxID=749621 RepID=A0A9W8X6U3_9PLEO|nr:hypothetical protein N0V87_001706 [Didymella glomerata]